MEALYPDRAAAGQALGAAILRGELATDAVVLALPRGGVVVGAQVALAVGTPLDVLVVRKLGVPGHEELAMGAVAGGGVRLLDDRVVREAGIDEQAVEQIAARAQEEVERREADLRGGRPGLELSEARVILVDDGMATGSTMRAAIRALRALEVTSVVVAVPVGSAEAVELLTGEADTVICLKVPSPFEAVGAWYERFEEVGDEEVRLLLGARS